jgi:hypothetical protein
MVGDTIGDEVLALASPIEPNLSGLEPTQFLYLRRGSNRRRCEHQHKTDGPNRLHVYLLLFVERVLTLSFNRRGYRQRYL